MCVVSQAQYWNTTNISTPWCKMATQTPRKFQEKIALLQQREAESKEDFERIMNEVQTLTKVRVAALHLSQVGVK